MNGEVVLGLLRVGDLEVAVALAALREVVPCPQVFAPVAATAPGLLGVMTVRSRVVPVLDLLLLLGRPHDSGGTQVVVVVAHQGRLVGLLADEIRGLATVAADGFDRIGAGGTELLFSTTFTHPERGEVVSVLDPDRLLGLPGVPVVQEEHARGPVGGEAPAATRSLTLVRCGSFTLALDVAHVHSTVPAPALSRSAVDGPVCLGTTLVAGHDVAVLDLLALLGLGSSRGTDLECGLVVDLPAGQVVLGVGSLIGLRDVAPSALSALPLAASPVPELLGEVADVEGVGACLVVDGAALLATGLVQSLSRVGTVREGATVPVQRSGSAPARGHGAVRSGEPHLAYRAGVDLAADLTQVAEVLAFPADLVPAKAGPAVLGFVLHRGGAVTVTCLARALGRPPAEHTDSSRLLLVEVDGERLAFAVDALHAIAPLVRLDPQPGGTDDPERVLHGCPLVELGGRPRLLPLLDLVALGRSLRAAPAPASVQP